MSGYNQHTQYPAGIFYRDLASIESLSPPGGSTGNLFVNSMVFANTGATALSVNVSRTGGSKIMDVMVPANSSIVIPGFSVYGTGLTFSNAGAAIELTVLYYNPAAPAQL